MSWKTGLMSCGSGMSAPFLLDAAKLIPLNVGGKARHLPSLLHVFEGREHTCLQVIKQVAVEDPEPGIVCVESDRDPPPRRHENGISERTGKPRPVDLDDLKRVSVEMHRVR